MAIVSRPMKKSVGSLNLTSNGGYCFPCRIAYDKEHICPTPPKHQFLHEQVYEIAEKFCADRFHKPWIRSVSFPRLVQALVDFAFEEAWDPQHRNCVIIRTAYKAINNNQWSYNTPAYP